MKRNTIELPLPREVKHIAKLDDMQEKLKLFEDVIHEYEENLAITADLQCEITEELNASRSHDDILLLKAIKAIALMTKNMGFYKECLAKIIPRLKNSLKGASPQDVKIYQHYIMLAEQELNDLENV